MAEGEDAAQVDAIVDTLCAVLADAACVKERTGLAA